MPQLDLPLDQLRRYRAALTPPPDLWEFWRSTLSGMDGPPPQFRPVASGLVVLDSYDVTFAGFGGHPVRAWLHLPARPGDRPLPGVVQYMGYNGGRGLAHEHVFWACAGYAHLVVDTRGQGSGWTVGDTADPVGAGPSQPGFLTRGIEDPHDHYYRRVYADAVRALDVLRGHPSVDSGRIAVTGVSQGGGIALAVTALAGVDGGSASARAGVDGGSASARAGVDGGSASARAGGVAAVMPDVPFLCDFARAVRIATGDPYAEIARYLAAHRDATERVFTTLSYIDAAVLAAAATVPALFSVALMDSICPPSTIFGAFHEYAGPKDIMVYEFNDHEGGEAWHRTRQLTWLAATLADRREAPHDPASGPDAR